VNRMLTAAVETVRPSADAKLITISTAFGPGLGTIVADSTRLHQILWNLLTNAVKFTPRQGTITVMGRRTSSHLQLTVKDSGEGIDPSFLPHIFEPFRQAESPSTRVHGGLGLGLSIVRYLAEAHGGTIAAESEGRGKGAAFTVTLPVAAVAVTQAEYTPSVAPRQPHGALELRDLSGIDILVVDDDREGRNLVSTILRKAGAKVIESSSAAEALEILSRQRPALVLSDIAMPHTDGYELLRQIRQRKSLAGLKVVALSAFSPGKATSGPQDFDDYLAKPIDPVDLVDGVHRAVYPA
jgi:CheY-like chemotaxis protein